jgi:hypothetical protein
MENCTRQRGTMTFLNAKRSSKYEQLLIRPLLRKIKNTNMAGGWKLKRTFYFMETTQEPLQLDK